MDAEDFEFLNQWKWKKHKKGYAYRNGGKGKGNIYMHRLLLGLNPGEGISDHINRNKLDNQRTNLRAVTQSESNHNRTLATEGVYKPKGRKRWTVCLWINKRFQWLGSFASKEEAIAARVEALREAGLVTPQTSAWAPPGGGGAPPDGAGLAARGPESVAGEPRPELPDEPGASGIASVRVAHAGRPAGGRNPGAVPRTEAEGRGERLVDGHLPHGPRDGRAVGGMADHRGQRRKRRADAGRPAGEGAGERGEGVPDAQSGGVARGVFHPASDGREPRGTGADGRVAAGGRGDGDSGVGHADCEREGSLGGVPEGAGTERPGSPGTGRMADADGGVAGHGGVQRGGEHGQQPADGGTDRVGDPRGHGPQGVRGPGAAAGSVVGAGGDGAGFWSAFELVACRDGKARRVEPGTFPLAHGSPARVGRLRGYGNALVAGQAAQFVRAFREVEAEAEGRREAA